jgi:probable 2-oxoglutarate dehydrogenase E1 component DHKTD1
MMSLLAFENHANTCFRIVRNLCKYSKQSCVRSYRDCCFFCADTQTQLQNRASNAALVRYVDSMRTHGHRAARIDPLDLIHREEVAALFPARYGLVDEKKKYNVNGILWRRIEELGEVEDWLSLRDITEYLKKVYVGNIAYEVRFRP